MTDRRTKVDWALCRKDLVDISSPQADKITVVMDHVPTHHPASLYEAFPPEEARRLLERLAFHSTPKHGSWLNRAAMACSVLQRQCLDRRIPDQAMLQKAVAAWEQTRNAQAITAEWRFTTKDARIKLKKLYPSI